MLKLLLKKTIVFLFTCLFMQCQVFALDNSSLNNQQILQQTEKNKMELVEHDIHVSDIDIDPLNTSKVEKDVVPDTKTELQTVIEMFLKVMFAIAVSIIIIYFLLLFIKRKYGATLSVDDCEELDELDLATPSDKEEALRIFLKKTR